MARVTVEDCLDNVENLFQLVLVASKRARQLSNGAEATVPIDRDKPTVVALREVAEGNIGPAILDEPDRPLPFDTADEQPADDNEDKAEPTTSESTLH